MQVIVPLDEKLNPVYYGLINESNSLIDRWDSINSSLHTFKVPKILLIGTKKKLVKIGEALKKLQGDYLNWQEKTANFFLKPHYKFETGTGSDLAFSHWTDVLFYRLMHLELIMQLIANNYNARYDLVDNRLNFLLALIAVALGLAGLVVSLVAIL